MLQQYCEHGGIASPALSRWQVLQSQKNGLAAPGQGSQPLQGGGWGGTRAHSCRAATQQGASKLHMLSHHICAFMSDC